MALEELDGAIDALVCDVVVGTHPAIDQVVHGGPLYFEACNALSMRVAVRFLDGDLSFWDADAVMNWVWSRMLDQLANENTTLAESAMSIYEAFDAGEFHHRDDDGWVDPVEKYTRPELEAILSHRSEQQPD